MRAVQRQKVNMIGIKFGKLTIREELEPYVSPTAKSKLRRFKCLCDCGNTTIALLNHLYGGRRTSCGCRHTVGHDWSPGNKTHGKSSTREYVAWQGMLNRCRNPNHKDYKYYGARGIGVCPRWAESFEAFTEDMGPRPKGLTLERKDNDKNYEPDNCVWATLVEQAKNKRKKGTALCL